MVAIFWQHKLPVCVCVCSWIRQCCSAKTQKLTRKIEHATRRTKRQCRWAVGALGQLSARTAFCCAEMWILAGKWGIFTTKHTHTYTYIHEFILKMNFCGSFTLKHNHNNSWRQIISATRRRQRFKAGAIRQKYKQKRKRSSSIIVKKNGGEACAAAQFIQTSVYM